MSKDVVVDSLDRKILDQLRQDGRLTNQELAARVGLTPGPCWRRVRRLETEGIIVGYSAVIDPVAVGQGFEVLVQADLAVKEPAAIGAFEQRVVAMPQVIELRRMFGIPDYFIRVRVADVEQYERWLTTELMVDSAISRIDSRLTMKELKTAR